MADDKWALFEALPDGLDAANAVVYREIERDAPVMLGGQHFVFDDGQVWQQREDGLWKRSIFKPADFDASRWVRVES